MDQTNQTNQTFPTEVLIRIFSYLRSADKCKVFRLFSGMRYELDFLNNAQLRAKYYHAGNNNYIDIVLYMVDIVKIMIPKDSVMIVKLNNVVLYEKFIQICPKVAKKELLLTAVRYNKTAIIEQICKNYEITIHVLKPLFNLIVSDTLSHMDEDYYIESIKTLCSFMDGTLINDLLEHLTRHEDSLKVNNMIRYVIEINKDKLGPFVVKFIEFVLQYRNKTKNVEIINYIIKLYPDKFYISEDSDDFIHVIILHGYYSSFKDITFTFIDFETQFKVWASLESSSFEFLKLNLENLSKLELCHLTKIFNKVKQYLHPNDCVIWGEILESCCRKMDDNNHELIYPIIKYYTIQELQTLIKNPMMFIKNIDMHADLAHKLLKVHCKQSKSSIANLIEEHYFELLLKRDGDNLLELLIYGYLTHDKSESKKLADLYGLSVSELQQKISDMRESF